MRAAAILLGLLGALACANAERKALLIGIDSYPCLGEREHKLRGVQNDLRYMEGLFAGSGFRIEKLVGPNATSAAIRGKLDEMQNAASGDVVAVYFSGRGSLAASEGKKEDLEPTLAPYDAELANPSKDIPMSRLEAMARAVTGAGAQFLLILDCSYEALPIGAKDAFNYWDRDSNRSLGRTGKGRDQLFLGPGVVLAACGPKGATYEWRLFMRQSTGEKWSGAFTHVLSSHIFKALSEGAAQTYQELIENASVEVLERGATGKYMPGFRPYPSPETLRSDPGPYAERTAFTGNAAVSGTEAPLLTEVKQEVLSLESGFRVGFEWDESFKVEEREPLIQRLREGGDAKASLESAIPGLIVAEQFSAKPDRIIVLSKTASGLRASVLGEPVIPGGAPPVFEAKALEEVLGGGLREYLELTAIVYEIARLAEMEKPSGSLGLRVETSVSKSPDGTQVLVNVRSKSPGLLYLVDRNFSDAVIHLSGAGISHVRPTISGDGYQSRLGLKAFGDGPGKLTLWTLLAAPEEGFTIPPRSNGMLPHLRALRDGIRQNKVRWQADRKTVEVVK